MGLEPNECIVFEDSANGVKAAISAEVGIIVAVMDKNQRNTLKELIFGKEKSKLFILDSLDKFDFSLLKSNVWTLQFKLVIIILCLF